MTTTSTAPLRANETAALATQHRVLAELARARTGVSHGRRGGSWAAALDALQAAVVDGETILVHEPDGDDPERRVRNHGRAIELAARISSLLARHRIREFSEPLYRMASGFAVALMMWAAGAIRAVDAGSSRPARACAAALGSVSSVVLYQLELAESSSSTGEAAA